MFIGMRILRPSALGLEMLLQWSVLLIALAEDQSLEPSKQIRQLTKARHSSPKIQCPFLASGQTHTHRVRDKHKNKSLKTSALLRILGGI